MQEGLESLNLVYLCNYYGLEEVAEYWHQVVKINDYQKDRFAQKIIDHFGGDLTSKRIAILGWAFKANTNDSRESPSIYVTCKLLKEGFKINIYDPMVNHDQIFEDINENLINYGFDNSYIKKLFTQINVVESQFEAIKDLSVVAIITEWSEFSYFDWNNKSEIKIFDGRNLLKNSYYRIG